MTLENENCSSKKFKFPSFNKKIFPKLGHVSMSIDIRVITKAIIDQRPQQILQMNKLGLTCAKLRIVRLGLQIRLKFISPKGISSK